MKRLILFTLLFSLSLAACVPPGSPSDPAFAAQPTYTAYPTYTQPAAENVPPTPYPTYTAYPTFTSVPDVAAATSTNVPPAPTNTAPPAPILYPSATPGVSVNWVHNPALGAPSGYPGYTGIAAAQQASGPTNRTATLTVATNQVGLVFGDEVSGLPFGKAGGQWSTASNVSGCFLIIAKGPTSFSFTAPGNTAWEIYNSDGSANPDVWAAQKLADLKAGYPDTCGKNTDVWVYGGSAPASGVSFSTPEAAMVSPVGTLVTNAGVPWYHVTNLTTLPAGSYAGLVGDGPVDHDQSDGLPRTVELHVLTPNQIFLIFGDHGNIPSIGDVGGPTNCYLIVGRGRIVWITQPIAGEFGLISWPGRSKFELYNVTSAADVFAWAAAKMKALMEDPSYPNTCAKGVDLWVKYP